MQNRRVWIYVLLFLLCAINYLDRVALSVSGPTIQRELGLNQVQLGYLFSSFLWLYVVCLVPMGALVDRFGSRLVNSAGMAVWSAATLVTAWSPACRRCWRRVSSWASARQPATPQPAA